jgi:cytochrome c-type biogenesis protein CcmE
MNHPSCSRLLLSLPIVLLIAVTTLALATSPDNEDLLRVAFEGKEPSSLRAVNALAMRGYFASKPRNEARKLIATMPENVRMYVEREQPWHSIGR